MRELNKLEFPRVVFQRLPSGPRQIARQQVIDRTHCKTHPATINRAMLRRLRRRFASAVTAARDGFRRVSIRFASTLVRCWQAHAERRQRLQAMTDLEALSDRQLKDIGVARSEISWITRHGRYVPRARPTGVVHAAGLAVLSHAILEGAKGERRAA